MGLFKLLIFLFHLLAYFINSRNYNCENPTGKEVDWFSIFMIPKSSSQTKNVTFGYFDSESKDITYLQYDQKNFPPITMSSSIDIKTSKGVNYFFWNDDSGDGGSKSSNKAHSKGSLVFNSEGGYFITHSLPRFPDIINNVISNDFPDNAGVFAQSWLCISITKEEAVSVANELNIINPNIFLNVTEDQVFSPPNPIITKLIKNRGDPKLPQEDKVTIKSKRNINFTIFSKSKKYNDLMWDGVIPEAYDDDFLSETWTKPERLPDVCNKKYNVYNVLGMKFGKYEWDYDNEHSKWGLAMKKAVICFGDLNRTESQKSRGGLVVCFENKGLADIVRKSISTYEPCKKKSKSLKFLIDQ